MLQQADKKEGTQAFLTKVVSVPLMTPPVKISNKSRSNCITKEKGARAQEHFNGQGLAKGQGRDVTKQEPTDTRQGVNAFNKDSVVKVPRL